MGVIDKKYNQAILDATGARTWKEVEVIQGLWSGYGNIVRIALEGAERNRIVVKHINLPQQSNHPRGWNTNFSHQRKVKSYEVETVWYTRYVDQCSAFCPVPKCLAVVDNYPNEVLIILEDIDEEGFPIRRAAASIDDVKAGLHWLANFHAEFLHTIPEGLWSIGTYWHLDTRPDELKVMDDVALRSAAGLVDAKLNSSPFLTFVHGDAKLANFCFSADGAKVAAVDFQYVGGGVGVKDVAYFISSCFYEEDCERYEQELLAFYFSRLKQALERTHSQVNFNELEANWRELYPVAWTDFYRFLKGWSPDHWKINSYSERLAKEVLKAL